jgi:hypothetical protein
MRRRFTYALIAAITVAATLTITTQTASAAERSCTATFAVNNVSARVCMWWVDNVKGDGSENKTSGWRIDTIRIENHDNERITGRMGEVRDPFNGYTPINKLASKKVREYTDNEFVAYAGGAYWKVCLDTPNSTGGIKIHFRRGERPSAYSMRHPGETPPIEQCTL